MNVLLRTHWWFLWRVSLGVRAILDRRRTKIDRIRNTRGVPNLPDRVRNLFFSLVLVFSLQGFKLMTVLIS